ncbi:hypothetical protein IH970_10925 [candidate division KSB1 bacterium]|nr:hypothetical protein [candidate division KSB1 bacterium]
MITVQKILEIYGIDPSTVKLVRHGDKEIPIRETFIDDMQKLEAYQSFQRPNKFGKAKAIAVFAPYYKTTALYLGLWDIGIHRKFKVHKRNVIVAEKAQIT